MRYEFKGMFGDLLAYFDTTRETYMAGINGLDSFVSAKTIESIAEEMRELRLLVKQLNGKEIQMKTKTTKKTVTKKPAPKTKK